MALHLHRAIRADVLADGLGDLLATPLPDPFATELVVVPARGVERWLSQRLSHLLGAGRVGATASAPASTSAAPRPWSPRSPAPARTTRGRRTRWSGRCSRCSTRPSTSRGRAPSPGTSATA